MVFKKGKKKMVACNQCGGQFAEDALEGHMEVAHPDTVEAVKEEPKEEGLQPYTIQQLGSIQAVEVCNLLLAVIQRQEAMLVELKKLNE